MKTYVALLRGINVVGNNVLPMKELKLLVERNGCADVRTYIQSGNVVFRSDASDVDRLASRLRSAIVKDYGFEPRVLLRTREQLQKAISENPFPEASDDPTRVHLFFLEARPKHPDLAACDALKTSERFALKGTTFYLHTPDGFGRSKLAGRAERYLGVAATARNWRTVTTLLEMARG